MRHVFKTDKGTVVLDPETDKRIYNAPCNPPNTGTTYTRGTDLYLHITRKGNKVFYLIHWSLWQGEGDSIELISEEQAKEFFREKTEASGWARPDEDEIAYAEKLWPDLFEETA